MSGAGQVEPGRLSLRVDGTTLEQRGTEHTPEEVYVAPRRMGRAAIPEIYVGGYAICGTLAH